MTKFLLAAFGAATVGCAAVGLVVIYLFVSRPGTEDQSLPAAASVPAARSTPSELQNRLADFFGGASPGQKSGPSTPANGPVSQKSAQPTGAPQDANGNAVVGANAPPDRPASTTAPSGPPPVQPGQVRSYPGSVGEPVERGGIAPLRDAGQNQPSTEPTNRVASLPPNSTPGATPGSDGADPPRTSRLYPEPKPGPCLKVDEVQDGDGDFRRNEKLLSSDGLCINQKRFQEGGLSWNLQIVRNTRRPNTVLWMVPHDNENAAFDTAVRGVIDYGGTIVAVETGGERFNQGQDPNRNFDAGTGLRCAQQRAPSPVYTREVLQWLPDSHRIVALHSNEPGYAGDGRGGSGGISILHALPGNIPFRSARSINARSPDDTLVFVASVRGPQQDPGLKRFVNDLNASGINVMYETVSKTHNDCSLSNFAALSGLRDYINVEVVHGDSPAQQRIVSVVMKMWNVERAEPAIAASEPGEEAAPPPAKNRSPRKQFAPEPLTVQRAPPPSPPLERQ
jgi:hypothetical protein